MYVVWCSHWPLLHLPLLYTVLHLTGRYVKYKGAHLLTPAPTSHKCYRCFNYGHYVQNCPLAQVSHVTTRGRWRVCRYPCPIRPESRGPCSWSMLVLSCNVACDVKVFVFICLQTFEGYQRFRELMESNVFHFVTCAVHVHKNNYLILNKK